jgi:hypothetical protein
MARGLILRWPNTRYCFNNKFILYKKEALHRPRKESIFLSDWKLIGQRITGGENVMTWALDEEQMYTFNSVNNLVPINKELDDYKYFFTALLNSKIYNNYIAAKFTNKSKLTVNISKTFLENLPLVIPPKDSLFFDLNGVVKEILTGKDRFEEADKIIEKILRRLVIVNKAA